MQDAEGNILAATDYGVVRCKCFQLQTQSEGFAHRVRKAAHPDELTGDVASFAERACRCEPGNLAFKDGHIDAANAGRFAGAENMVDRSSLQLVDCHEAVSKFAAEERRQLYVGYKMKAASEIIARDLPLPSSIADDNGFEPARASRGDRP